MLRKFLNLMFSPLFRILSTKKGRTFTVKNPHDGSSIDLGGQWISSSHKRLNKLARELDVKIFPQFEKGLHILDTGTDVKSYSGFLPPISMLA